MVGSFHGFCGARLLNGYPVCFVFSLELTQEFCHDDARSVVVVAIHGRYVCIADASSCSRQLYHFFKFKYRSLQDDFTFIQKNVPTSMNSYEEFHHYNAQSAKDIGLLAP